MKFSFRIALACFSALFSLLQAGQAPAQFGISATIDEFSPTLIPTEETTEINVVLRNTGAATFFDLQVDEAPSGWNARIDSSGYTFLGGGDSKSYTLEVTPTDAEGDFDVSLDILAEDLFGSRGSIGTEDITLAVMAPPGEFQILAPETNDELPFGEEFQIAWERSSNADNYDVTLARYEGGQPQYPAQFSIEDIGNSFFFFDSSQMERGTRYEVKVFAKNIIGETENSGGPRPFSIEALPPLGGFAILTPQPDEELWIKPRFNWEPSENAETYTLAVRPEVDGGPGSEPLRVVEDITASSYEWPDPPLEGDKAYYLSVTAHRGDDSLVNIGGVVRFTTTGLRDFELIIPAENEEKLPLQPEFRWEASEGAQKYVFHIVELVGNGSQNPVYTSEVNTGTGVISFLLPGHQKLKSESTYLWWVEAIRDDESRENLDGPRVFDTTDLTSFDLLTPQAFAEGVGGTPLFRWEISRSALSYFVEITTIGSRGQPTTPPIAASGILNRPEWQYDLTPLVPGRRYAWRVGASDGKAVRFNYGNWQTFTVTPLSEFTLSSPSNEAAEVATQPTLRWQRVPGAQGYRVYLAIPGGIGFQPMEIDSNTTELDLADAGVQLNSLTTYSWTVEAVAGGATLFAGDTWLFTTEERDVIVPCDYIDHLIGRQVFGPVERALGGIPSDQPLDCSTYITTTQFEGPCVRE